MSLSMHMMQIFTPQLITLGQNYESHYELHVSNETQQEHPHHTESSNSSKYELISSVIKDEEMYESL